MTDQNKYALALLACVAVIIGFVASLLGALALNSVPLLVLAGALAGLMILAVRG